MDNLVILKNNEPLTTSLIVARELNRSNKGIVRLIKDYENDFKEFGILGFENAKTNIGKSGRPEKFYYLNEQQFTFLIMMLRVKKSENDLVLNFKKKIAKEFFYMRKWILNQKAQKQNQEYIETRGKSKIGRKQQTDIIKDFIEYAKNQGSKNADKYYMIFSKMENAAFFILKEKFKNVREILNITQLSKIIVADMIVNKAINDGMKEGMFYKDIFKLAKERILDMSNNVGDREIIPNIELKQIV
jgi:phage regulator Rha-like protein